VTRVASAYFDHTLGPGSRLEARAGATASLADGSARLAPRIRLRWRASTALQWTLVVGRTHQFAQSLRNPESVVGNIFPADLFLGADADGVPVARADQAVLASEWRPIAGVRVGAQAFARELDDLLLPAPRSPEPFSEGGFVVGTSSARGASVHVTAAGARYGVVAGYGWQRVRMTYGDSAYVPGHAAAHRVDAGIAVYPSATWALRLSLTGATGRTGTGVTGAFEWESCNLLDRGCEFAGSPRLDGALGAVDLPPYLRVDVGARKHWHFRLRARDTRVGVFGTVTNVLGRRNVLTYVTDPGTGRRDAVEMLPRSPLVLGLDWWF
jgi:hypothetical protein